MKYFSGAIYKLLKTVGTRSKGEEILKISSISTCKMIERGKPVLKVHPLDEHLAQRCFLGGEQQKTGGQILANAALLLTLGGFGWDTASVLDSLVKHGPSITWNKMKENFHLIDDDKEEMKDQAKNFLNARDELAKRPDLEQLEMKIGKIETLLLEILQVLKKEHRKPKTDGADGEKPAAEVSESDDDDE